MATEHKAEDVISFARLIFHGSEQSWGRSWHQREIDGFFYNRFLNHDLQTAIREARVNSWGREDAPYPCQWNDETAKSQFVKPWGENGSLDELDEYFLGGNGPQVAHWTVGVEAREISRQYSLSPGYLTCAVVHGSPIPFDRLYSAEVLKNPAYFHVKIYALPFGSGERNWVEERYDDFREWASRAAERNGSEIMGLENWQAGANVRVDMRQNPLHLEVISHPPFVSPKTFIRIIQETIALHKTEITGSASTETVIREWTIYLLSTICGLSSRKAIRRWNETLGGAKNLRYKMAESSVTNTGEQQFSRDKAKLEKRIEHYRAMPGYSVASQIT